MKNILYSFMYCICALIILSCLCSVCLSEDLDQVTNPRKAYNKWVSDMAGVIGDEEENQINNLIDQLEQKTTAEIAVVTIQRTDGRTPKEFATELLNRWGIGKKDKDNGALVLLVMEERRVEVETGYDIEGMLPDGKVGEILDKYVIPYFKQGNFGGGLLAGVQAMAKVIAGESTEPSVEPSGAVSSKQKSAGWLSGLLMLVLILAVLIMIPLLIYWGYRRASVRRCKQCGQKMRKLNEVQDDAYLSFAQKFEEDLGSVDYRVWRCDNCQTSHVETAIKRDKKYEKCPKCGNQTVYVKSYMLTEPTHLREGLEEIKRECRFPKCGYETSQQRKIPSIPIAPIVIVPTTISGGRRSSSRGSSWRGFSSGSSGGSSFGGSFGGGSSGGGGAGRSW